MSTNRKVSGLSDKPLPTKDSIFQDLHRLADDSDVTSNAGSTSSSARRRRRKKKHAAAAAVNLSGIPPVVVLPTIAESKPVRLQIGLNLNVELELKAKITGDLSLSLVVEERQYVAKDGCKELKFNREGVIEVVDLYYMRLGTFSFKKRWCDGNVSKVLTAAVIIGIAGLGVAFGFMAGWMMRSLSPSSCGVRAG